MTDKEIAENSMMWAKRFARRVTFARHIIDELAQEAAIGILNARAKYNAEKGVNKTFASYAEAGAFMRMRRHISNMAGPVKNTERMPESVSLVSPEADDTTPGQRDNRTCESLAHETAEFNEALGKVDTRVQLMIEAKLKGATYDEIADGMGVSREFVRRRVTAFAAELGVAA